MIETGLNLRINDPKWETVLPEVEKLAEEVVTAAVDFVNTNEPPAFFTVNKPLSFNLCLSNNDEVHTLNREFRHIDRPTNVLSFANIDDTGFETEIRLSPVIEAGDIIIALETMQHEAGEKQIGLRDHFCHLLTHGVLHLLGYDHIEDDEAEHMEHFETEILKRFNISNPYEE